MATINRRKNKLHNSKRCDEQGRYRNIAKALTATTVADRPYLVLTSSPETTPSILSL
jgi:hypothetical protein